MHTPDLRIFLAVASAGSLSAAARQINAAPMQVSRRIAALEGELGVRLFHRTTRSVSLTAEGEALLPYATTITDAEDSVRSELSPLPASASGTLRFTAPSVFGQELVMPLLPALMKKHPELRIDLDLSDSVVDLVGQGLDLALRVAPLGDSDLVARRLAPNPRLICASPSYLRRHGRPSKAEDLEQHECVSLEAVPRWPLVIGGQIRRRGMSGRVSTTSVEAVRTAALQGLGLAMLTYWDVHHQLADGSLEKIELDDAGMEELSIWAIMPTRRFVPTRVKVFLNALEASLHENPQRANGPL